MFAFTNIFNASLQWISDFFQTRTAVYLPYLQATPQTFPYIYVWQNGAIVNHMGIRMYPE